MDNEQAIRIICQLLDEYKNKELNWNLGGKQEIYYDVNRQTTITGEAEWEARFETRTVGDEEQPMELLEPTLEELECHILTYGEEEVFPINDELITLNDL